MSISAPQPEPKRPTSLEAARAKRARRDGPTKGRGGASQPPSRSKARARRNGGAPTAPSATARNVTRFEAAAERAAARDRIVAKLKTEVDAGTYRADPDATAHAMQRRSES